MGKELYEVAIETLEKLDKADEEGCWEWTAMLLMAQGSPTLAHRTRV